MPANDARVPQPALATLTHARFWDDNWIYERKLDGQRCLARRERGQVRLYSRSGHNIGASYPEIARALAAQEATDFVVDGELVAFDGPRTSFARLQPRIQARSEAAALRAGVTVFYYVFDVLSAGGRDLRDESQLNRKRVLRSMLRWQDPLRLTPYRRAGDEDWWRSVCERGWEGVIAKRADAGYESRRTAAWLKFKCEAGQELVIVGWTEPQGTRRGIGALVLGYHDREGDLVYAGKVGTGFDERTLVALRHRLEPLGVATSPCRHGHLPGVGVHWVRPKLVAQVAFTEWTRAGQLRHPRFLGLRDDKAPADVVREQ